MPSYEKVVLADSPSCYWPLNESGGRLFRNLGSTGPSLLLAPSFGAPFADDYHQYGNDTDPNNWFAEGVLWSGDVASFKVVNRNSYGKVGATGNVSAYTYGFGASSGDRELAVRCGANNGGTFVVMMDVTPGATFSDRTGYGIFADSGAGTVAIRRIEGGGNGTQLASVSTARVEGDLFSLCREGDLFSLCKNGVTIARAQDSTYPATARQAIVMNGPANGDSYSSLGGWWQAPYSSRPKLGYPVRPDGGDGIAFLSESSPNGWQIGFPARSVSALNLNAPVTVEFWFVEVGPAFGTTTPFPNIFGAQPGGWAGAGGGHEMYAAREGLLNNWRVYRNGLYYSIVPSASPVVPISDGLPHHIAYTVDNAAEGSKTMRCYVDGVLRKTNSSVTWGTVSVPSRMMFGTNVGNTTARYAISDMAIYGAELSASAIRRHYLAGLA